MASDESPGTPTTATGRWAISAIDVVRFLVQLFAFFTFAWWGFVAWSFPMNLVFGIGTPVFAILLWALFCSPKAVLAVHPFVRAFVELAIFAGATAAWWGLGQPWIGLAFAVVAVASGLVAGRRAFN